MFVFATDDRVAVQTQANTVMYLMMQKYKHITLDTYTWLKGKIEFV